MNNPEVMFNLWYMHGGDGLIYSIRVRAYLATGTEEENLALLRQFASTDYLIARPFAIPQAFHVKLTCGRDSQRMPVTEVAVLQALDSPIALFEEAIKQMERDLPAQSHVRVPESPLVCVTPLLGDEHGDIKPFFTATQSYK